MRFFGLQHQVDLIKSDKIEYRQNLRDKKLKEKKPRPSENIRTKTTKYIR